MPSLGLGELLLIGIVLLLVVGPKDLPHAFRAAGRTMARMRRAADELRRAMNLEADRMDEEERLKELRRRRLEQEEERRRLEQEHGTRAQDAPGPPADADEEADVIPPGFTPEEWADMPEHIREIIRRRRVE